MKHNFKKILLPLALLVVVPSVAGCSFITDFISNITGGSGTESGQNLIDYDNASKAVKEYYNKQDILNKRGINLQKYLHSLMWSTHGREVYYKDYASYCSLTSTKYDSIEKIPNKDKMQSFYTGAEVSTYNGTREHVWPCAASQGLWVHDKAAGSHYVDGNTYRGGGSDLYHVRLCNSALNTARGDGKFCEFTNKSEAVSVSYGGGAPMLIYGATQKGSTYEYAQKVEVDDSFKGDVARILAYVWLHYNYFDGVTPNEKKGETDVRLTFTNVLGYTSEAVCKQKLVEWNNLDPVSEVEKHRNDTVQGIQGNRNPFVDFPNLMAYCFSIKVK